MKWSVGEGGSAFSTALLTRCWASGGHPLGPDYTRVVEQDGQVVAAIVGGPVARWLAAESAHPISAKGLGSTRVLADFARRLRLQTAARPPLSPDHWYVSSLGVIPSHRGRGLARTLVADAAGLARGLRLAGLVVEVVEANLAAVSLYRSMGFVEAGRWQPAGGPQVLRLRRTRSD